MDTITTKDRFKLSLDENKRVFHDFEKYLLFAKSNSEKIQAIKIKPPRLGSRNFGSIEVKLK